MTKLNRSNPPFNAPIKDFILSKPQKMILDNGLPINFIDVGSQPILNIQLLFKAGRWSEQIKGASSLVSRLLFEGTKNQSAESISRAFDSIGAYWEVNAGMDYLTIEVYALSKHLDKVLNVVQDCIQNASFPENEFFLLKKRLIQQLKINIEKNNYKAGMEFREKLFGNEHPYGYPITSEMVSSFSLENVITHYQKSISEKPFEIIVAGQVEQNHFDLFNKFLGSHKVDDLIPEPNYSLTKHSLDKYRIDKDDASQSSIRVGKVLLKKNHPDTIRLEVLNEVLGGYFGSRLMKNIREKRGLTYGIYSSLIYMKHAGYLLIGADVKKERLDEALEQIFLEIDGLKKEPIGNAELHTVKNYLAGNYIKSINTPIAVAEYFKTIHFNGLSANHYDSYVSKINAVTTEEVYDVAKKYLAGEFLEVSIG